MTDERSANANDKKLGQRVRARRLEIGVSQERLAEACGVTFQQVQKWEKGVNRIACSRMIDIAAALDMPVGKFFEGLKAKSGHHAERFDPPVEQTTEGIRAAAIIDRIKSAPVRRRVLALAEAVAGEA